MTDLEVAKEHLEAWLMADLAVSKNQSYQMGSKRYTRADAGLIAERIKYWKKEVTRLSSKRKSRIKFRSVIPRDL
ncbi:DUF6148 family protein [Vallitalea guaymasensis]|uniref:DUF6148 family protein n=1 Tax=Vallitalea guaymasensis TaxID=1185412 RepID=UPI000DE4EBD3|nr:DUF6148 family protein [Vallitalea guaymasensis]